MYCKYGSQRKCARTLQCTVVVGKHTVAFHGDVSFEVVTLLRLTYVAGNVAAPTDDHMIMVVSRNLFNHDHALDDDHLQFEIACSFEELIIFTTLSIVLQ